MDGQQEDTAPFSLKRPYRYDLLGICNASSNKYL